MSIRQSIAITFGTRYAELVLGLISSIILARLLTPEDFGIFSIAASIAGIGYLLRNFGVGQFIIQAESLDDDLLRAAFSVTLGVSWAIALALAIGAPWLGDFYADQGVARVLLFLSLNFVILPFGAITDAVLHRRMQFEKLAVIRLVTSLTTLMVGVTAAWLGARYMSIAWAANAGTLATILMTLVYRPPDLPWKPGIRRLRTAFSFGAKVGALDLLNKGSDALTELIIGKAYSLRDLGIYSRAFGTFMLFEYAFIEGVRPVVLPFLSDAKRDNTELGPVYLKIVQLVSIAMVPFFTFLYFAASSLTEVLYGHQWDDAVPLLQVLCLAGLFMAPTMFFEQLLIAFGRPGKALQYQLAFQSTRILALILLLGGELRLAALAFVLGSVVKMLLVLGMAKHYFALKLMRFAGVLSPAVLVGLAVGFTQWLLVPALDGQVAALTLTTQSLAAGIVWLIGIFALRHPASEEVAKLANRLRRQRT